MIATTKSQTNSIMISSEDEAGKTVNVATVSSTISPARSLTLVVNLMPGMTLSEADFKDAAEQAGAFVKAEIGKAAGFGIPVTLE